MKVYRDIDITNFEFWSGAITTVELLTEEEMNFLQEILEESYQYISETTLNDFFWFETEFIAEMLGYDDFETLYTKRKR